VNSALATQPPEGADAEGLERVYVGYRADAELVGVAIVGAEPGYQDVVRLMFGYDPRARALLGIKVLESRETPGLGDKIAKDEAFLESFRDLSIAPEVVAVKKGRRRDNEIDAISGATISSVAVARIINQANARWVERLPPPDAAAGAARKGG